MDEISPLQFLCFRAWFDRNQACFLFHLPILTRRPCVVYFDQQMDASHVICLGVLSSFSFTYGKKEESSSLVGHWLSAPRDHDLFTTRSLYITCNFILFCHSAIQLIKVYPASYSVIIYIVRVFILQAAWRAPICWSK